MVRGKSAGMFCGTGAGWTAVGMHGRPAQCPQASSPAPASSLQRNHPWTGPPRMPDFQAQQGNSWADWDKVVTLFLSCRSKLSPHPLPTSTLLFPVPAPFLSAALDIAQPTACICDVFLHAGRPRASTFILCAGLPPGLRSGPHPRIQAAAAQKTWSPSSQTPGQLWICSLLPGFLLMAERRLEISNLQRHRPSRRP